MVLERLIRRALDDLEDVVDLAVSELVTQKHPPRKPTAQSLLVRQASDAHVIAQLCWPLKSWCDRRDIIKTTMPMPNPKPNNNARCRAYAEQG